MALPVIYKYTYSLPIFTENKLIHMSRMRDSDPVYVYIVLCAFCFLFPLKLATVGEELNFIVFQPEPKILIKKLKKII